MITKLKTILRLFIDGVTDEYLFQALNKRAYIRNGKSHFIGGDDEYLLKNEFIQVGFGRVISGYGCWAGGGTRASTSPLKITIDKEFIIQKIETDSFYNSQKSKEVERRAKKIAARLKVGEKLILKNDTLLHHVTEILKAIPVDHPITHDVFEHPHMLNHYTKKS